MIKIFQQFLLPRPLPCGYIFTLSADCNRPMNNKYVFRGRRHLLLKGALVANLAGSLAGTLIGALPGTLVDVIGLQFNWAVSK